MTARVILLAAMARFSDDPLGALSLIGGAGGDVPALDSQEFPSGSRDTDRPDLSTGRSISRNSPDEFPRVSCSAT